ncbi:MAG: DUF465 domain-containing protein [Candidatus Schekmanbacteria bacterium]|nr:DUF465 domain-containing protein [Candidatus Schekmanbacteria bacterium]
MQKSLGREAMGNKEELLKALREENEEFRSLEKAHREYEVKLEEFEVKKYLSPTEEVEKARIKKLKLLGKDRMESLIRDFNQSVSLKN